MRVATIDTDRTELMLRCTKTTSKIVDQGNAQAVEHAARVLAHSIERQMRLPSQPLLVEVWYNLTSLLTNDEVKWVEEGAVQQ